MRWFNYCHQNYQSWWSWRMFDFCWWWRRAVSVCDHDRRGNNEIWSQVMITMWLRYEYNGVIWLNKTSIYFKIFSKHSVEYWNRIFCFTNNELTQSLHFILKFIFYSTIDNLRQWCYRELKCFWCCESENWWYFRESTHQVSTMRIRWNMKVKMHEHSISCFVMLN